MLEQVPPIPYENLPLGFRFHPTGEQLINHYLKRKLNGTIGSSETAIIPDIELCKFEPWDLVRKSMINLMYEECFFFARVDRKYKSGNRWNRATEKGYWKPTGRDRLIRSKGLVVGMKKSLVFHVGRKGKGVGTGWVMHEYRTVEDGNQKGVYQGEFVICSLFKKEGETGEHEMETNAINETVPNLSNQVSAHIDKPLVWKISSSKTTNELLTINTEMKLQHSHSTMNTTSDHKVQEDYMHEVLFMTPTNQVWPIPETTDEPVELLDNLLDKNNLADSTPDILQPEKSHSNINIAATDAAYSQVSGINQVREESLFDGLKDFLGSDYTHSLISDDNPEIWGFEVSVDSDSHALSAPTNLNVDSIRIHGRSFVRSSARLSTTQFGSRNKPSPVVDPVPSINAPVSNDKDDPFEYPFIEHVSKLRMRDYGTNVVDVNIPKSPTLVEDANTGNSVSKLRMCVGVLVILLLLSVLIWLLKKYI